MATTVEVTTSKRKLREDPVVGRVFVWFLFTVIMGAAPIGIAVQKQWGDEAASPWTKITWHILGEGELLIISSIICVAVIGEWLYLSNSHGLKLSAILCAFGCVFIVFFALPWYSDIRASLSRGVNPVIDRVAELSLAYYIAAAVLTTISVGFIELIRARDEVTGRNKGRH
jgi:hypothetical protein